MARPLKPRLVCQAPEAVYFKPRGIPLQDLDEVVLGFDETEALRLADLEDLSQEQVGKQMGVSRATVGRILKSARGKVAEALVQGKALRIAGGVTQPALVASPSRRGRGLCCQSPGERRRKRR